jgi:DNA-binding CsgD family transcriptional regulator
VPHGIHGRVQELAAIERFVAGIRGGAGALESGPGAAAPCGSGAPSPAPGALSFVPGALLIEGEAGIGKTTLVEAAVRAARARGLRVLECGGSGGGDDGSARPWAALGELLAGIDAAQRAALPAPQHGALAAALGGATPVDEDWRAVATAVRALLAAHAPALVAIDDAHALDAASARVLAFCARRPAAGVGLLVARRPEAGGRTQRGVGGSAALDAPAHAHAAGEPAALDAAALDAGGPLAVWRLGPLEADALRRLLRERAAEPLGRGALAHVEAVAAGNPRLALALAAAATADGNGLPPSPAPQPPRDLRALADAQLAGLDAGAEEALLAVASLAEPTIDAVARALGPRAPQLLDAAEERGILERAGRRVRFARPLLAGAVYAHAPLARRRAVHRRLAGAVADPEERARQLAHARAPQAIPALRAAAIRAGARGAPLAAAELLELALDLGAPAALRVRAAEQQLAAGDPLRARELLEVALPALGAGRLRARALLSLAELRCHDGDCATALELLERARREAGADGRLRAAVELRAASALTSLGRAAEAEQAAQRALAGAQRLGDGGLHAQALAACATAAVAAGGALDERRLARAIELEDPAARCAFELRPSLSAALALLWDGRPKEARLLAAALRARHTERGEDAELAWAWLALAWIDGLRGELDAATDASEQASELLAAIGTPVARALGLAAHARVAALRGRAHEARQAGAEATAVLERAGWSTAARAPRTALGQLALSLGNAAEAAAQLAPACAPADAAAPLARSPANAADAAAAARGIGPPVAPPAPPAGPVPWGGPPPLGDAAEALVALGRLAEAEPLVARIESHACALAHPWPRGAAARARGLLLAARGELDAAQRELSRAVAAHASLPIPLERGRSLLALGLVERRRRQRLAAHAALTRAIEAFEAAGAPAWTAQARAAQAGVGLRTRARPELTRGEERVACLAAAGLTNREIAATLHISPKTVEAALARAYRKLGVGSRAQLGARMGAGASAREERAA